MKTARHPRITAQRKTLSRFARPRRIAYWHKVDSFAWLAPLLSFHQQRRVLGQNTFSSKVDPSPSITCDQQFGTLSHFPGHISHPSHKFHSAFDFSGASPLPQKNDSANRRELPRISANWCKSSRRLLRFLRFFAAIWIPHGFQRTSLQPLRCYRILNLPDRAECSLRSITI